MRKHDFTQRGANASSSCDLVKDNDSPFQGKETLRLTQFHNQLEAVDKATPLARIGSGKSSPMTTHAAGPHVEANPKIYTQTNVISTLAEALDSGAAVPTIATINSHAIMRTAPQMRSVRRPNLSIVQNASGVDTTLTTLVMTVIRNGLSIPDCWKNVVPTTC